MDLVRRICKVDFFQRTKERTVSALKARSYFTEEIRTGLRDTQEERKNRDKAAAAEAASFVLL